MTSLSSTYCSDHSSDWSSGAATAARRDGVLAQRRPRSSRRFPQPVQTNTDRALRQLRQCGFNYDRAHAARDPTVSAALARIGDAGDDRSRDTMATLSPRPRSARKHSPLVTAGNLRFAAQRPVPGDRRDHPVPVLPALGQLFLIVVMGGMYAGAMAISASHLPSLLAFLLATGLPMALRFFAQGSTRDSVLAAMIVVFVAALSLAGRRFSQTFAEALRLRFELNEANLRLAEADLRRTSGAGRVQLPHPEILSLLAPGHRILVRRRQSVAARRRGGARPRPR